MSGPTQHLPFFSSAETASLEQLHEGFTNNFATVHEFFIYACDDFRLAFKSFHDRQKHRNYAEGLWQLKEEYTGIVRETTYDSPVAGTATRTDTTSVVEMQHFSLVDGAGVMEIRTTTTDVPRGDHFNVVSRWRITEGPEGGLQFTFSTGVNFIKATSWRVKIEDAAKKSASQGFMLWIDILNSLKPDRLAAVKPSDAVLATFNDHQRPHRKSATDRSAPAPATTMSELGNGEDGVFTEDTTPAQLDHDEKAPTTDDELVHTEANMPVPAWAAQQGGPSHHSHQKSSNEITFGRGSLSEEKERARHDLFIGSDKLRTKLARIMPSWKQLVKRHDDEQVGDVMSDFDVVTERQSENDRQAPQVKTEYVDPTAPPNGDERKAVVEGEASTTANASQDQDCATTCTQTDIAPEQMATPEPELYECVFYRRRLGFTLKFFNDVPVVVAVDNVEQEERFTPRSALSEALMSRPTRTESETASFTERHSDAEDHLLEAPATLQIEHLEEPVKVAVQCDEVFGEGIKRVWKCCPPTATTNGAVAIKNFSNALQSQYNIDSEKYLHIHYLDADLDQFVQLEPAAWSDFMVAHKKIIQVQLQDMESQPAELTALESEIDTPSPLEPVEELEHVSGNVPNSPAVVDSELHNSSGNAEDLPAREGIVLQEHGDEMERRGPEIGSVILSINGVRVVGLDQDQVVALLTHQSRPLVVEFRESGNEEMLNGARERTAVARMRIQYATFERKYEHKLNTATRKTVDRFFSDFNKTNWVKAVQDDNGTPGASLISVYRWVEHEMTRVGLFDNSTSQGSGLPEMGEEQWDDVREHIERFMMKACLTHSLASFPEGPDEDVMMTKRLASLRFLRPWHFGLEYPPELVEKYLTGPQWSLAMSEMCKALLQSFPTDILRRLKLAVRMIAHTVEALLGAVKEEKKRGGVDVNPQEAVVGDSRVVGAGIRPAAPPRVKHKVKQKRATVVGADDLLPVLTWVLAQANPPHLMQKLWFVTEFKHPDMNSLGEESYCLAQVVSAAEFMKNLEPSSLAITPRDFELGVARYRLTQRLIDTPKGGTLAMCKQLLADGGDVNGMTPDLKDCPISVAIKHHQKDMVKLFLEQPGVDVNIKLSPYSGNPRMTSTLMLASIAGDAPVVLILLKAGADRYMVDSEGNTAASVAMQAGHLAVVKLLLADPEHITLSEACSSGNMNLVDGLLGQGVQINERHEDGECTPLIAAAYMGHLTVLNTLLHDRRTDVNFANVDGETALMFSAQPSSIATADQKVEVALRLLARGANRYMKDTHGRTALSWAERWGHRRLSNILKYDPAQLEIFEVSKDGKLDAVEALIDQSVDVNKSCPTRQFTPLIAAVFNSGLVIIDRLLKCPGIDINIKGRQGMTALHYASQIGNTQVVGRLLAAGADRAIQDERHMLPRDVAERKNFTEVFNMLRYDPKQVSICLAAMHGDWQVISSLLLQGVSVNTRQKHHSGKGWHHERYTPLIAAVAYNKVECVKKLLAQPNIDVNLPNLLGQTPLMYAAAKGNERLVLILLRRGANRYLVDRDQRSSLAWAMKYNHIKIAHILSVDPARTTIQDVIREGNKDQTVALFKQRVDVNYRLAISDGDPRGALNVDGETPLIAAARYYRNELLMLVLKSPDLLVDLADASGKSAMLHAAMVGNEQGVLMLLHHGANRQHMDYDRKTAADYASAREHETIATILKTDPERVCIHVVCVDGDVGVLNALLRQGVSANAHDLRKGSKQETPLIVASKHNRLDVVEFLLAQRGIQIDATDADGRTALMVAAAVGALDITAALLKAGANRHLKDRAGLNADNWAGKFGHMNLMRFIGQQIYY